MVEIFHENPTKQEPQVILTLVSCAVLRGGVICWMVTPFSIRKYS